MYGLAVMLSIPRLTIIKTRGWVPKFATGLVYQIRHSSKIIWVTMLIFCHNNSLMRGSVLPKDSLITYIIFELCLIWYISPVSNFWTHPLILNLEVCTSLCPIFVSSKICQLKNTEISLTSFIVSIKPSWFFTPE